MEEREVKFGDVEDSAVVTVIARLSMIAAAVVGLPVAGWMLARAVSTVDRVEAGVMQLETHSQILRTQVKTFGKALDDHEVRIRVLEKPPIVVQPPVPVVPKVPGRP